MLLKSYRKCDVLTFAYLIVVVSFETSQICPNHVVVVFFQKHSRSSTVAVTVPKIAPLVRGCLGDARPRAIPVVGQAVFVRVEALHHL